MAATSYLNLFGFYLYKFQFIEQLSGVLLVVLTPLCAPFSRSFAKQPYHQRWYGYFDFTVCADEIGAGRADKGANPVDSTFSSYLISLYQKLRAGGCSRQPLRFFVFNR